MNACTIFIAYRDLIAHIFTGHDLFKCLFVFDLFTIGL